MARLLTNLSAAIIFILGIALCYFTIYRGTVIYDEGYIVNSAQRILDGQIIYRDFHFAYTPGSAFVGTLWFYLFGSSLMVERLGTVFFSFNYLLVAIFNGPNFYHK